jgi:hypothetical protein
MTAEGNAYPQIEITLTPDGNDGQPQEPRTINVVPDSEIGVAVNHEAAGGYTIFTRGWIERDGQLVQGEVAIRIDPPVTESSVRDDMPQRGITEYQTGTRKLLQGKIAPLQRNLV